MTEMLHIPTLTPRPVDNEDRLARRFYLATSRHTNRETESVQEARSAGYTTIGDMDELYSWGLMVHRFASFCKPGTPSFVTNT